MATSFDIEVPRQGDWLRKVILSDADRVPVDLTGCVLEWRARPIAGGGVVLATADIVIVDAEAGEIQVRWHGPDFDGFGLATEIVRVAHDLKLTDTEGAIDVLLRGQLLLFPEVTA